MSTEREKETVQSQVQGMEACQLQISDHPHYAANPPNTTPPRVMLSIQRCTLLVLANVSDFTAFFCKQSKRSFVLALKARGHVIFIIYYCFYFLIFGGFSKSLFDRHSGERHREQRNIEGYACKWSSQQGIEPGTC